MPVAGATGDYRSNLEAKLEHAVARLAADEASHFALLNFDLKRPFSKAFAFGA